MSIDALADVSLDDPKLNKMSDTMNLAHINNKITTKAFKISPKKDHFSDPLIPFKSPATASINIMPYQDPASASNKDVNYKRTLKEVEDLTTVNKDLINELELLQQEINQKNQLLNMKSIKIEELIHEKNQLVNEIKIERENNENDFNSWLDLKTSLELQIHNLQNLPNNNSSSSTFSIINSDDDDHFNEIQLFKNEINKLKKKVNVLTKENELEIESKTMIMDELELMRAKYLEIDSKYGHLKIDYDELINELLILRNNDDDDLPILMNNYNQTNGYNSIESSISDHERVGIYHDYYRDEDDYEDEESEAMTPTLESSVRMEFPHSNSSYNSRLRVKKKRINSQNSNDSNSRIASLRNNSLNKAIREVELNNQKQKYKNEMFKNQFEINSLKLQVEKLLSYVGYLSQLKDKELKGISMSRNFSNPSSIISNNGQRISSNDSNKTETMYDNIEYSDAYNIETARQKLKTVMKSVSAMQIRPSDNSTRSTNNYTNNNKINSNTDTNTNIPITVKKNHHKRNNNNINNSINHNELDYELDLDLESINNLTSNSIDCSTDYNQGEVELLQFGNSEDSFEEFGDDELDDDDEHLYKQSSPIKNFVEFEPFEDNDNIIENNLGKTLYVNNKNSFASNSSLNVSYKMNSITPMKKKGKLFSSEPRTQLKKITPSTLNLRKNYTNEKVNSDVGINKADINFDNANKAEGDNSNIIVDNFDDNDDVEAGDNDNDNDNNDVCDNYDDDFSDDLKLINGVGNNKIPYRNFGFNSKEDMYLIIEEGESDFNDDTFSLNFSSSDENDEDGYEDETFNISNQEIDMFKISLNRFSCPKHSMFQCFCHHRELVNRNYYRIFSSPIYTIRRRLRRLQRRKMRAEHGGINGQKLKLRYQDYHIRGPQPPLSQQKHVATATTTFVATSKSASDSEKDNGEVD